MKSFVRLELNTSKQSFEQLVSVKVSPMFMAQMSIVVVVSPREIEICSFLYNIPHEKSNLKVF